MADPRAKIEAWRLCRASKLDWGLTIKGIYGREMFETWRKMLAMLQSGLDVRGVITHRRPAERFAEDFGAMRAGEAA